MFELAEFNLFSPLIDLISFNAILTRKQQLPTWWNMETFLRCSFSDERWILLGDLMAEPSLVSKPKVWDWNNWEIRQQKFLRHFIFAQGK